MKIYLPWISLARLTHYCLFTINHQILLVFNIPNVVDDIIILFKKNKTRIARYMMSSSRMWKMWR